MRNFETLTLPSYGGAASPESQAPSTSMTQSGTDPATPIRGAQYYIDSPKTGALVQQFVELSPHQKSKEAEKLPLCYAALLQNGHLKAAYEQLYPVGLFSRASLIRMFSSRHKESAGQHALAAHLIHKNPRSALVEENKVPVQPIEHKQLEIIGTALYQPASLSQALEELKDMTHAGVENKHVAEANHRNAVTPIHKVLSQGWDQAHAILDRLHTDNTEVTKTLEEIAKLCQSTSIRLETLNLVNPWEIDFQHVIHRSVNGGRRRNDPINERARSFRR